MSVPDLIGILGVVAYVSAYALLQTDRLASGDNAYLTLNALGSIFILVSLSYSFNLPSFLSQTFWLLFTIVGFWRRRNRRAVPAPGPGGLTPPAPPGRG